MATNNNNDQLQLVPETVLKRKHDMDEMKAKRAAQAITNPRGNRKVFSKSKKVIKVHKAETFVANARARRNHEIRYKRVLKKGMQKRASKKKVIKQKTIELDDEGDDEEITKTTTISFQSNSVDAPMVFVVRVRDQVGCPLSVKRALSRLRLRNVYEGVFVKYNLSAKKNASSCRTVGCLRYTIQGNGGRFDQTQRTRKNRWEACTTFGQYHH
mmetsp:Transcript_18147/g.25169  ORF Transcript_18147/g.25169 Transcript_18147/m.25169 type:complete len:213 (-) Transcript_18147:209-847(-)